MENQAAKTGPVSETAGKTDTTAAGQDQRLLLYGSCDRQAGDDKRAYGRPL